ncbi:FAD-dependent oxidoreductase [Raoultibacter massiliensis]|uniref:FAD-binding protein n=1 Tax=Raoultibacter massiliensis TaxID=1852371 RepID=A0ABV1JAM6_9ACTN|nr:FAD-binding protein [Raoultibacter massiliensis]
MEFNQSRRSFLKTTGAAVAGAAGIAAFGLTGCAASQSANATVDSDTSSLPEGFTQADFDDSSVILEPITSFDEEKTYDIVVVGAGTAGMPAVLTALEEGATVACLQKESTAIAQGGGDGGICLEASTEVGVLQWLQAWRESCNYRVNMDLARFFAYHSGETSMWMAKQSKAAGYPPVDSWSLHFEFADGNYVTQTKNAFGVKPENNGNLVRALADYAETLGADMYYSTPGVQLVMDGDRVAGVVGQTKDRKYIKFNATKGVILATGDYQNNKSMISRFAPDLSRFTCKQTNKTGDGILMSAMAGGYMSPVGHSKQMHDMDAGPYMMIDIPFLAVNENGERFMNEQVPMHYWDETLRYQDAEDPGKFCRIFDNNYVEAATEWGYKPTDRESLLKYVPGAVENPTGVITDLIDTHRCDTLDELAEELGIPAENLKESVARYNELCESGEDTDFGKEKKYLSPIVEPPFWGIHQWIRLTAMCCGIKVDANYQVVDTENNPIVGLYAVGFGAGDMCGDGDWSLYMGNMSCGSCMTSGRYATIHALTGDLVPSHPASWEETKNAEGYRKDEWLAEHDA